MQGRMIEEVTLVREITREQNVTQAVSVEVTESGMAAGLTLEDVLAHIDENGAYDDIRQGNTVLASVSVDEDVWDDADNDNGEWETESVVYADTEPDTIDGCGLDADEIFRLATKRYRQSCEHRGQVPQQPCLYRSLVSDDQVVLANVKGELARYRIVNGQPAATE